jgi:WS/DGAT/MGAT family acyltransferase
VTLASYRGLLLREFRRIRIWQLSPLAAEVGPDRAVAFTECTIEELRTLGKAIDREVTVNDVLIAVIAGALRRWLQTQRAPRARMKVQVPMSMHPHLGDDDPCGNRNSFFFVKLPLWEDDPVARVRAVSKATRLRKNRQDAHAIYALREYLSHAPPRVRGALQRLAQGPYEYSLNVSNVPGPKGPIHVLGHRVTAMYSIAEIAPFHALRVAAVSLGGALFVGLCADPKVIPDLDALADGIRVSIDELHERLTTRAARAG